MKSTVKYIDESGKETSKEKAVGRIVSVYDDNGRFIEERFGSYHAKEVQLEDDTKYKD
jgi:hypothetical protein